MTRPEDPTKEGFALAGWYSDFDMTREWDFDKDTVQGSMTLYAKWVDASQLPAGGFPYAAVGAGSRWGRCCWGSCCSCCCAGRR